MISVVKLINILIRFQHRISGVIIEEKTTPNPPMVPNRKYNNVNIEKNCILGSTSTLDNLKRIDINAMMKPIELINPKDEIVFSLLRKKDWL